MKISHLRHHEIDKARYDNCIMQSLQSTVYGASWYLDTVSPGWELIATENYEFVMPLPVKQKTGISYMAQPPFCQQLGIFSSIKIDHTIYLNFIDHIPYSHYRLQLNFGNVFSEDKALLKRNYLLDLNQCYQEIRNKYNSNCLRNLKKAENEGLSFSQFTELNEYFNIITNNAGNRPILNLFAQLKKLIYSANLHAKTEIWNVQNQSGNIIACTLFLHWKDRIYYMVPISTLEGKEQQAMSFLIDRCIHHHSSSKLIFDFEGSSIPGIARFYEGFGSKYENYPLITKDSFLSKLYTCFKK